ncbi:MAG: PAS domain-containing protein [Proteobacteria bacterium]|nr:PAS domain-containing protein [Pseudomonadota bacterium]
MAEDRPNREKSSANFPLSEQRPGEVRELPDAVSTALSRVVHQTLEHLSAPVYSVDVQGRILTWNPACQAVFSRGIEIVGQHVSCLMTDHAARARITDAVARVFSSRRHLEVDLDYRSPEGLPHRVPSRLYPVCDESGRVRNCVCGPAATEAGRSKDSILQERDRLLDRIAQGAPFVLYVYDLITKKNVFSNEKSASWFGWKPDQLANMDSESLKALIHPEDRDMINKQIQALAGLGDQEELETIFRIKDASGHWRWLKSRDVVFSRDEGGAATQIMGCILDLTDQVQARDHLREAAEEKEVLLREIHHRVKNNLQVVSSLLSLQSQQVDDERVRNAFLESQNRIMAMALIHELLYESTAMAEIDLHAYVHRVASCLFHAYDAAARGITLKTDLEGVRIPLDFAVPCGLVINELLSNALKHAFPGRASGEVRVAARQEEGDHFRLVISDNGIGLPATPGETGPKSLGLALVRGLVERQLCGCLDVATDQGTSFTIVFHQAD